MERDLSIDLTGKQMGFLKVLKLHRNHHFGNSWLCLCECGKEIVFASTHLLGSKNRRPNKSCGCKEKTHEGNTIKHYRLYQIWQGMKKRCYNEDAVNYERYGGKGVYIEEEWKENFQSFLTWSLSNDYKEGLTIDRIDSKKPYGPENCRWVDYYVQNQNKSTFKNNKTGHMGISKHGSGFRAHIQRNKEKKYLGYFKNIDDAISARKKAEEKFNKTGQL
jgi:hypothetical protein